MVNDRKTYRAPWQGQLLLACRKCQKKLKGERDLRALAKLKKTVKRLNKEHVGKPLHIINVPCMDLCPRHGVTVCETESTPRRLSILRSESDIELLFDAH
jgi:predicted metal-binding protein